MSDSSAAAPAEDQVLTGGTAEIAHRYAAGLDRRGSVRRMPSIPSWRNSARSSETS